MNKKEVGAALRRGVLAGTIAGCVAGWATFASHGDTGTQAMTISADEQVDVRLPAVPDLPKLAPLPNLAPAPAAAPVLQPLPNFPRTGAAHTTTRTS